MSSCRRISMCSAASSSWARLDELRHVCWMVSGVSWVVWLCMVSHQKLAVFLLEAM